MERSEKTSMPATKDDISIGHPFPHIVKGILPTFQQRPTRMYFLAGILALLILGLNFYISVFIPNQQLRTNLSDVIVPIADVFACLPLFLATRLSFMRMKRLGIDEKTASARRSRPRGIRARAGSRDPPRAARPQGVLAVRGSSERLPVRVAVKAVRRAHRSGRGPG